MMDKVTLNKVWPLFLPAVLLLPLLFVTVPVAATPGQVANPSTFEVNGKTNITISNGPSAPHAGEQIAVWNPAATPIFSVGCNLPGDSGGIKWELRADTDAAGAGDRADFLDATSARVSYNIPAGALGTNKLILEFGDGGNVPIYLTGTTTISPFFADPADPVNGVDNDGDGFVDEPNPARYAWIDLSGGVLTPPPSPGTDNTADTGLYKFASCGREGPTSPPQARYVGTTTFTVEEACKWCNKGAVLSQVTQNLGNCCTIPDIIVDVRDFDGTLDQSDPCETVDDSKVGSADPATCSIQAALNYITDMTNWVTNGKDPTPGDGEIFIGVTAQDCTDTVCEKNNNDGVCDNCANNTSTDPARPPNGDGAERFIVTNPYTDRLNIFGCSIDIFEPNNILAANAISPIVTIKDSVGKVTVMDIHVHGSSVGYLIENNADLVVVKNSRAIGGVIDDAVGALVNGDTIGYLVNDENDGNDENEEDDPKMVEITGSPEISGWDIGIQLNGNLTELRTNGDIINNGIGIQINGLFNESNNSDPVGKEGEPNGVGIEVTGDNNDLHDDNVSFNTGDGIQVKGDFNKLEGEDVMENGEDGIDVSGNGNQIIKNKQVKMNGDDGIEVSGGNDPNELEENVSEDNTGNGINLSGNGNSLKKNEAEDNMMNGIEVSGDNNTLEENETHDNDKNGVKVTGDDNQLTKNDSNDNGEHGMLADGEVAPNPSGNKFDENDADDNVKQGIRACGQIDQGGNTGSGNGEDPQVDFDCLDIDLTVEKTDSPDPVTGGNELTYTLTVKNTLGTDPATGVKVVDELPDNVTFNSAVGSGGSGFSCSHSSGTVTCTGGSISAGGSVTITIKVQIGDDGLCGDTLKNKAEVDPDDDIFESNENNNETGDVTTVVNCANLTVDASGSGKTDSPDPVVGGSPNQLTYTVVIKNTGTGNAVGVKVVDTLPSGTTFVAASLTFPAPFSCSHSSGVITCTGGTINAASMATITYKVTITNASSLCGNDIDNDLVVDPDDTVLETNEGDNEDSANTDVICADLDVTFNDETSGQDLVLTSGFTSKARYTLTNNGDAGITTVVFPGTIGGTATRNTPTVAFSGDSAGWSCGTLNTTTWSCSGPLAAGDSVNIVFTVTGAAQTPPKTVTYTPGASTCTNAGPCTDNVDSFGNEDGNDITPVTDTDNLT